MFENKNILIGITGGIAAYKTCELIREIKKNRGNVRVVMTKAASKFITPLTLATLSENPVLSELFTNEFTNTTVHIDSARWADVILICPATANTIGKVAAGIADNLLTTLLLAATVPVIICPAMNKEMFRDKLFQDNVDKLAHYGYDFVEPDSGELACGEYGAGRLAESEKIITALKKRLLGNNRLAGKRILVTAGRTEEPLDPVRFISNRSTGKMGFALAEAAYLAGAEVTLISGPTELEPFDNFRYFSINTSEQMAEWVNHEFDAHDILIMTAAVADFKPKSFSEKKIKKNETTMNLDLVVTTDILKEIGGRKGDKLLVGFALETHDALNNAEKKLKEKKLDLIVLNNPNEPGAGFGHDTNIVTLIEANGQKTKMPKMSKNRVAEKIINKIADMLNI